MNYALRQAGINQQKPTSGKRMWGEGHGDTMSVCEGEPLYSTKHRRGTDLNEARAPIAVLSSLNGSSVSPEFAKAVAECNSAQACACKPTLEAYTKLRDEFFKHVSPSGVSVSKWDYRRRGQQQQQFVATRGGGNTIYVDEDVEAGDTLVYDIPKMDSCDWTENDVDCVIKAGNEPGCQPFGLVPWHKKRGVPDDKRTLVVRAIPRITTEIANDKDLLQEYMKFRLGFQRRGQFLGKCIKGAKAGERCDVNMEGTSLGMFNCRDA